MLSYQYLVSLSGGRLTLATGPWPHTVYKISGHPGILTHKIAGGCQDFSTWESAGLPCFIPVCTSIYSTDAHRFWRTTRFNDIGIRRIAMFCPFIYTLTSYIQHQAMTYCTEYTNKQWSGFMSSWTNHSCISLTRQTLNNPTRWWRSENEALVNVQASITLPRLITSNRTKACYQVLYKYLGYYFMSEYLTPTPTIILGQQIHRATLIPRRDQFNLEYSKRLWSPLDIIQF